MRKIYSFIAALASVFTMQAQLTQANHAATAGDTYQMYQCDSLNINPGANGANANWNFASINTRSSVVQNYSATTSANISFPNASVTVSSGTNNVGFYSADANKLSYYGGTITVGGTLVAMSYTSPAIQAVYPMSLNTTTTNLIGGSLSAIGLPASFTGTSSVVMDGTGTLTLPGTNATFNSASRVVNSQTINFNAGFVSGVVTQVTYDYYVGGIKAPAFTIMTSTLNASIAGTTTQTLVFRNKNATVTNTTTVGMKENKVAEALVSVYPNPCNAALNFKSSQLNNAYLQIFDLTGKMVEQFSVQGDKLTVSTQNYANGLYFYKIQSASGEQLQNGRITVSH
jgi:hypothetical protein